jgi:hypothetical protein
LTNDPEFYILIETWVRSWITENLGSNVRYSALLAIPNKSEENQDEKETALFLVPV